MFLRDPWNTVDTLNYVLFTCSILFRVEALLYDIPKIQTQLEALDETNRYSTHVDFSVYSWRDGIQNNINAFNAILTWMKIFKYLEVIPEFKLLTDTLSKAAKGLSTLCIVIVLVLIGSAQVRFPLIFH